jgi:hypothetical protein
MDIEAADEVSTADSQSRRYADHPDGFEFGPSSVIDAQPVKSSPVLLGALTERENLASGKTVTADNAASANPASNAADGDMQTDWRPSTGATTAAPHYLTVDLGQVYNLEEVVIHWARGARNNTRAALDYTVQISSDGVNYTAGNRRVLMADDNSRVNHTDSVALFGAGAQYVRLHCTANVYNKPAAVAEIEIYDQPLMKKAPSAGYNAYFKSDTAAVTVDDSAWSSAVGGVTVSKGGAAPEAFPEAEYRVTGGQITLDTDMFTEYQTYTLTFEAEGYEDLHLYFMPGYQSDYDPPKLEVCGDLTGDGKVEINDLTAMRKYFATREEERPDFGLRGDINGKGQMDISDLTAFRRYFATPDEDKPILPWTSAPQD